MYAQLFADGKRLKGNNFMVMQIKGKTTYQNIAVGCWGIIDEQGRKWRMVNPPAELQKDGLQVSVEAQPAQEAVSIFMWGKPIQVTDFSILG